MQTIEPCPTVPTMAGPSLTGTAKKRLTFVLSLIVALAVPAIACAEPTESQFEKALSLVIGAAAPQRTVDQRERIVRNYVNAQGNKALALEPLGGGTYLATRYEDAGIAGDRALEGCELWAGNPCALILVNDDPETAIVTRDMPRLHYSGKFDVEQIPIIRADARALPDLQKYQTAPEPKAVAIHSQGRIYTATGSTTTKAAQDAALTKCNGDAARLRLVGPCFVYALNDNVIIFERRTAAR
jgi:hypothetical protein